MKLVLYSGGTFEENKELNNALISMLPDDPTITFVPSISAGYEPYYKEYKEYWQSQGINDIPFFLADQNFSAPELERLLQSDAIFLSGGNTFYFLKILKEKRLTESLQEYVKHGGILTGMSAGAIIMTPNIHTASVPSFDSDENEVGLNNLSSLSLTDFEFMPHYLPLEDIDKEILDYSRTTKHPILACTEGSGIVVNDRSISLIGNVTLFTNGQLTNLISAQSFN